jgi:threonine dehydrogenase-like Zn-dependent dehydrogenase
LHTIIMSSGKMMNAVRFHGQEDLRFEQIPEPECGKGQVKIKPAWCGICGRVCTRGTHAKHGIEELTRPRSM